MGTRSFFVPPSWIQGDHAQMEGQAVHQVGRVLRLRAGDSLELLDGSGYLYLGRISGLSATTVSIDIVERRRPATEPPLRLDLYQSLLKGEKMETVLQKGTEIGVSRFIPVLSERCVSRLSHADMERRRPRWETVVREAAEQAGRTRLPELAPLAAFPDACRSAAGGGVAVMAWEGEATTGLGDVLGAVPGAGDGELRVAVLVGPEGGFSEDEVTTGRGAGVRPVSLGPRILRAETAAVVVAALVMCHLGDMGR